MRNKYAGTCRDCGKPVAVGAGYFHNNGPGARPKWSTRCIHCVAVGKQARGDSLSNAQLAALGAGHE